MNIWKRRAAALLAAALCLSLLGGCGGGEEGMALTVCAGAAPESLDPIYATSAADQTILTHLYENLMQSSADENVNPGGQGKGRECVPTCVKADVLINTSFLHPIT